MLICIVSNCPKSGKTTVANFISKKYGGKTLEFSSAIEVICKVLFSYNGDKTDPKQRKILQDFGLACKSIDPHYWCWRTIYLLKDELLEKPKFQSLTENKIIEFKQTILKNGIEFFYDIKKKNLIISGARSVDEIEFFKKFEAKILFIEKNEKDKEIEHQVENELKDYSSYDYVIKNNYNLNQLYLEIDKMMETLSKNE